MRMVFVGLMVLVLLGGCASFGNPELLKAMQGDTSTNCLKVLTPWGTATYLRANPVSGKVLCDGMSLEVLP